MENVDVNGKSKAYLQGQKYVNLINAGKCKRISFEQMQGIPNSEATYIKINDTDRNSCEISQFQFYNQSDLRYIINNQDQNGEYFSLIKKTRYLLLSTPEQVFSFIMYAINKSYPLSDNWKYCEIQPNITLVLNNIEYFDTDQKNEYNLYQKLSTHFTNLWFDITETKSFQLIERILQYNIINNVSTTFSNQSGQSNTIKPNNHQLKIEWLTIKTVEQLHFMMINREQFKIIEEFRIVLPKQEINLDDIAPLLNITKELSVTGDAIVSEQATLDAITQIGTYAIKNITITIDSIKLDKLQKFIKHNADWINTDISILCNTVTIDNINKLLHMSHKYSNTVKQVVINDNIDKQDLDKITRKFQNKIQLNDLQHQAKKLTNEKLLLKFQKINQEIVFFKQENQELKQKLIETELRSKINLQQQQHFQEEFYKIIQQQQEQIKQLQEQTQMYNAIKLVSVPIDKLEAQNATSKQISKLALHQIENVKITFKPNADEGEFLPQFQDVFGDKLKLSSQAEIRSLQKQLNRMQNETSTSFKSVNGSLISHDEKRNTELKPNNYKNIRLKITKDQFKEVSTEKQEQQQNENDYPETKNQIEPGQTEEQPDVVLQQEDAISAQNDECQQDQCVENGMTDHKCEEGQKDEECHDVVGNDDVHQ